MQVDGPLSNGASARHRHPCAPQPRQQRAHNQHRSPRAAHGVRRARQGGRAGLKGHAVSLPPDVAAALPDQLAQRAHIGKLRHIRHMQRAVRQKGSGDNRQHRVFCRMHGRLAHQRSAGFHLKCRQFAPSLAFVTPKSFRAVGEYERQTKAEMGMAKKWKIAEKRGRRAGETALLPRFAALQNLCPSLHGQCMQKSVEHAVKKFAAESAEGGGRRPKRRAPRRKQARPFFR